MNIKENKESTKKLKQIFKNRVFEVGNNQNPFVQYVGATQSSRDTLTFMKRSKIFY